jgi:hypothetical protein
VDTEQGKVASVCHQGARSPVLCEACGATMRERKGKRCCSNRCRAAASRERAAERVRHMEQLIGELARLAGGG